MFDSTTGPSIIAMGRIGRPSNSALHLMASGIDASDLERHWQKCAPSVREVGGLNSPMVSARFKSITTWSPKIKSVLDGWPLVALDL